jgi:autotransporter strand-loop-strand O-heptosyltransferase
VSKIKIYAHVPYIGITGYNHHTRDFLRPLSKFMDIKVRNFPIGKTWKGYNLTPHNEEPYLDQLDKDLLFQQVLWNNDGGRGDHPIYPSPSKNWNHDLNLILCETNHHFFYDSYSGPKIAYNVWESTLQPDGFFKKLQEFDELWVPSKWQRDCTIEQGYDPKKIKVLPEGVDSKVFYPDPNVSHPMTSDGRFKIVLFGRWDYRKSIKEIIETFLKTFTNNEPVDLIISVDNPYSGDGLETTENRLKHYGLEDERIKILHFPDREDYIKILKSSNVFVSCARSEGWNLPLIEAMASGIPSIYSNCSGQLEFAEGRGIPVDIIGEKLASESSYNHFNETVGNYYEPNFDDLSLKMMDSYVNYESHKQKAIADSEGILSDFDWDKIAEQGKEMIEDFNARFPIQKNKRENRIIITYNDGPRVEILGDNDQEYYVEFIDSKTGEVLHSSSIKNNMWTACSKRYYIQWEIKINGEVKEILDLKNQTVLISMESNSIGDTIAWVPYGVEFQKKHKCKLLISTFHNEFFTKVKEYKDITFVKPGASYTCKAIYRLGWFKKDNKWGDEEKNPNQVNLIPLQQTATDILGLEFKETNYGLSYTPKKSPMEKEYVIFGPNATSGCKEWEYKNWVSLSKLVRDLGYEVIVLTKNPFYIEDTKNVHGESFDAVANYLHHAKAFVGLGSGLSWFNWALGNHTYMINGFAKNGHEFTSNVTRIYNDNTCVFCWNDEVFVFDPGDWDWCPVYKGTSKQHICQKSITPLQVFAKLKI